MNQSIALKGSYQEALRAVGAWLDIRGYHDVRIVEDAGTLVVEAKTNRGPISETDRIQLDRHRIERLCQAAKNDRGSALSRPIVHEPATT